MSVKQSISKRIFTYWLFDNNSDIKFDDQHDTSATSTYSKVFYCHYAFNHTTDLFRLPHSQG